MLFFSLVFCVRLLSLAFRRRSPALDRPYIMNTSSPDLCVHIFDIFDVFLTQFSRLFGPSDPAGPRSCLTETNNKHGKSQAIAAASFIDLLLITIVDHIALDIDWSAPLCVVDKCMDLIYGKIRFLYLNQ